MTNNVTAEEQAFIDQELQLFLRYLNKYINGSWYLATKIYRDTNPHRDYTFVEEIAGTNLTISINRDTKRCYVAVETASTDPNETALEWSKRGNYFIPNIFPAARLLLSDVQMHIVRQEARYDVS